MKNLDEFIRISDFRARSYRVDRDGSQPCGYVSQIGAVGKNGGQTKGNFISNAADAF